MPDFAIERRCEGVVCGVDEAGRGPLAASVIAKVTRDRIMRGLALRYPGYGWETNVGYATAEHGEAIRLLGVTPHHRRSFAPVRLAISGPADFFALLEGSPPEAADGGAC